MYKVKPYYGSEVLATKSDVMYRTPNLHTEITEQVPKMADSDPVGELERRQENILQKLQQLKDMVSGLKRRYEVPDTSQSSFADGGSTNASMVPVAVTLQDDVPLDLVISADPSNVPLSLFVMYELLKTHYKVRASTFVHSSSTDVPKYLTSLFNNNNSNASQQDYQIKVTFIWKKVQNGPSLMVDPHKQTPVLGESNIARYLMRLINPKYDAEDLVKSTQIDEWLDTANLQIVQGNSKEKAAALRSLNSRLGRNDWLVGSELSLADIVMWSVLTQSKQSVDAQANIKKWFNSCNSNPAFKFAKSLLC